MFLFHFVAERVRRWVNYRLTVRELSRLSDRDLYDLGINRTEIYRVAKKHGVSVADIKGQSRKQMFVYARQEAAYDLRKQRNLSLTKIGQMLGGKDHTTILYAISAHEKRLAERTATLGEPSQVSSPARVSETQAV